MNGQTFAGAEAGKAAPREIGKLEQALSELANSISGLGNAQDNLRHTLRPLLVNYPTGAVSTGADAPMPVRSELVTEVYRLRDVVDRMYADLTDTTQRVEA